MEFQSVDDLMTVIRSSEIEKDVVDATFDGQPVKVLVGRIGFLGADLVPLGILMTNDIYNRTQPPADFSAETDDDVRARLSGGDAA